MSFIPQDQLVARLGQNRYWFPKELPDLIYRAGIPPFEAVLAPGAASLVLQALPRGLALRLVQGDTRYAVGLSYADIDRVEFIPAEKIASRAKDPASVLGQAVRSGVLLGPGEAAVSAAGSTLPGDKAPRSASGSALLAIAFKQRGAHGLVIALVPSNRRTAARSFLYKNLKRFLF